MTLILGPLSTTDLLTLHKISRSAYENGQINRIIYPAGTTPELIAHLAAQDAAKFGKEHGTVSLGIWDDALPSPPVSALDTAPKGSLISVARWRLQDEETFDEVEMPAAPAPGADAEAQRVLLGGFVESRKQRMGRRRYWHAAHERRGAGRMLLQWGLDRADEARLECYLNATPPGQSLYEKFGFEKVGEHVVDLEPWGGKGKSVHALMVRPGKAEAGGRADNV